VLLPKHCGGPPQTKTLGSTNNEGEMSKIPFKDLPFLVKAAVFVSFFTAWVMFEELVIDRHGLWRFLPFTRSACSASGMSWR
jgi:hypothetical protein